MIEELLSIKGWKLFLGIVSLNLLIIMVSQQTLINEVVFFNTYSDQLTYDNALELFHKIQSYSWVTYAITPVVLILKFSVVSVLIFIGIFFSDLHHEVTLGKVFKVVIVGELIFITASIVKLLWFIFFAGNYTLEDMSFFYPLSLINLFSRSEVANYWVFPMQTVNVFQVLYVLFLALGLSKISSVKKQIADRVILVTYVPAMAVWITVIMFLTIDTML